MYISEILSAHAKINLALLVGERLPPQYFHILESLFVRLAIHDKLAINTNFSKNSRTRISISCKFDHRLEIHTLACNQSTLKLSALIESEEGIVFKTCSSVLEALGNDYSDLCIDINILKTIPLEGGLGGGSADAASILNFFSKNFSLPSKIKFQIAEKIGFDVGPCLLNSPSYVRYDGQHKTIPLRCPKNYSRLYAVILKPPVGSNTALAYQALGRRKMDTEENSSVLFSQSDAEILLERVLCSSPGERHGIIQNDFQENLFKEIPELEEALSSLSLSNSLLYGLSGSGSSIFSLFADYKSALKAYKAHTEMTKNGWFLAITEILSL